jgi:hypothetical protein
LNLRRAVLLALLVALVVSMVLVNAGVAPGWWLLINAAIVLAALVFERRGYSPRAADRSAVVPTDERFHDPTTGDLVQVRENPRTGEREYRPVTPP